MPEPLEIPIAVESTAAERLIEEIADDLEDLQERFKPVELDVDTSDAKRGIDDVSDDLERLDDEKIQPEIDPKVDDAKLNRQRDDIRDRMASAARRRATVRRVVHRRPGWPDQRRGRRDR